MKKQSKKFMLAGVVLLAIAGLLALTSCKNDSVPEPPSEADWLQEQKKELEGKTEGTITAPSYLTKGGLVDLAKLLRDLPDDVQVDLDLSQATGLTYIAAGTFIDCFTLQSVELPSSVTEIGKYAFAYTGLTSVTIPEGVTTIGDNAFTHTGLTSVTIPKGVTTIGSSAFFGCWSLTGVTIPASVTEIGVYAFAYTGLTEVTIPKGVTTIEAYAFDGCSDLTSVTFQETDGWCMKTDLYNEDELPAPIDVSKPEDNATNLKNDVGQWYGKYLIRK